MKIIFSKSAFRQLSKFDRQAQERIIEKLDFYASRDNPLEFAERLGDSRFGDWRFRIGEYRILFDAIDNKIEILKVGHRRDIYK